MRPFHFGESCITQEQYDELFNHGLGADCLPDPEPTSSRTLLLSHARSQEDCQPDTYFVEEACTCFANNQCSTDCQTKHPSTPIQNPLQECDCTTLDAYESIFEQGSEDCENIRTEVQIRGESKLTLDD